MKRRTFLTTAVVAGIGVNSGIAAVGNFVYSDAPWYVFPGFPKETLSHIDHFASEVKINLRGKFNSQKVTQSIVAPVRIISFDKSGTNYVLVYKNEAGNLVELKKKDEQLISKIRID